MSRITISDLPRRVSLTERDLRKVTGGEVTSVNAVGYQTQESRDEWIYVYSVSQPSPDRAPLLLGE